MFVAYKADPVLGVIFDLDGTLVDSRLDFAAMRRDIGVPEDQPILEYIETLPTLGDRQKAHEILHRHELHGANVATLIDGVSDFLGQLKSNATKLAVFTRNTRSATEIVVDKFFPDIFSHVITRDDAPPKPDPTGLLQISADWDLHPTQVIYIGDYLFDLQAGRAAGMRTFLYHTEPELPSYASQADHVFTRFDDLALSFERKAR
jgi:HAD superfamily hydrolase (TIGR01509 family)